MSGRAGVGWTRKRLQPTLVLFALALSALQSFPFVAQVDAREYRCQKFIGVMAVVDAGCPTGVDVFGCDPGGAARERGKLVLCNGFPAAGSVVDQGVAGVAG